MRSFVSAVVVGVVGGWAIGYGVDVMFVVNGRGLLVRVGWPLDQPAVFAAALAVARTV